MRYEAEAKGQNKSALLPRRHDKLLQRSSSLLSDNGRRKRFHLHPRPDKSGAGRTPCLSGLGIQLGELSLILSHNIAKPSVMVKRI